MAVRGGKRQGAGRPKSSRPVNQAVAARIKERVKAEELWVFLVGKAAQKARDTGNTSDLRQALEYLDDRDLGRCVDTVNHLHDKPIEVNHTFSLSDTIREARQRAAK